MYYYKKNDKSTKYMYPIAYSYINTRKKDGNKKKKEKSSKKLHFAKANTT